MFSMLPILVAVTTRAVCSNQGPAGARNAALQHAIAAGAHMACMMDLDCIPHPAWVASMAAALVEQPGLAVGRVFASEPLVT